MIVYKRLLTSILIITTVIAVTPSNILVAHATEDTAEESTEEIVDTVEDSAETTDKTTDDRVIPDGITIDGIDVSGMTVTAADEAIAQNFDSYDDVAVTINANGQTIETTAADLAICAKNSDVTAKAATYGTYGNFVERFKASKDMEEGRGKAFTTSIAADRDGLTTYINGIANDVNDDASDNTLERVDGEFVFKEGQSGTVVVVEDSVDLIDDYITYDWDKTSALTFELPTELKEPRGTEDELSSITDLLGSFQTDFSSSAAARANNVSNGASLINGTVLYPGDEFSVLSAITPFTAENGYQLAGSYENGTTVETYGGGICQVSTTLYGAVREAELEVVTRSCHSMVVAYVEPSQDAAISESGSKDFQIKNNKNYPVYIEGYTSGGIIYFNIYGKEEDDSGHSVDYETEITEVNVQNTVWIADESLSLGTLTTASSGHTGYKAKLWKIVYENGEETDRYVYNNSTYNPSDRTVRVGVGSDNAALKGAMINAVTTQDPNTIAAAIATYAPGVVNSTPIVITPKYSVTVTEEEETTDSESTDTTTDDNSAGDTAGDAI